MDALRDQHQAKQRDRTAVARVVEARQTEKKNMEDEMRRFREEHRKQTELLLAEYASVRETMGEYS